MSPDQVEVLRYAYGALATLCATGFIATLVLRWELLWVGERVLRISLVLEHLVIVYGAYIAIDRQLPASYVGLMLCLTMLGIIIGFCMWFGEGLMRSPAMDRLTQEKKRA